MDKTQYYKNCDYQCYECSVNNECAEVWDDILREITDEMQRKYDPKWPDICEAKTQNASGFRTNF